MKIGSSLKSIFVTLLIIATVSLLSSCGFQRLSPNSIPPSLRRMHLETPNKYSKFTRLLTLRLQALHVQLVPSRKQAPITLHVDNVQLVGNTPTIITNSIAATYSYSLQVNLHLISRRGKDITPVHTITITQNILLNANQILTPDISDDATNDMKRDAIESIYFWLISPDTQKHIRQALK